MTEQIPRILEVRASDFEPVIWHGYTTLLKTQKKVFIDQYLKGILSMLDYAIYCLNHAAADSKEIADEPRLYETLGRILVVLTWHRRCVLNLIEGRTGVRPSLVKRAYDAFRKTLEMAKSIADLLAGARLCIRMLMTAVRAGIFYCSDRNVRDVLLVINERDLDYDVALEDFLGKYTGEPDVFEPSRDVVNIVLDVCFQDFPQEPVSDLAQPKWVEVCGAEELHEGGTKLFKINGWVEVLLAKVDGKIHAVENICTHERGFLSDGIVLGNSISCIDHLAKFDLRTGRVLTQPHHGRARPLAVFPTRVENNRIMLGLYF
jgi:3-phenylpropionate/trans-cinnamate dioxygenase ferredoxin subunit